jgi:thiol-disulfide isomerase/thioredoxin
MKRSSLLAALAFALATGQVLAQEGAAPSPAPAKAAAPTLKVGDPAPALSITNWVKGDPVTGFEKGRTYVVEFWATWCGPCIASMPHLTELQAEYRNKGLVIIGVSSKDPNNSLEDVRQMVNEKGETMGYTVAFDANRETSNAYMKASGQRGIPCSFVVDGTGTIAYIGHPLFLDAVLDKVIAGKWDVKTDPATVQEIEKEFFAVYSVDDPREQLTKIASLESRHPQLARQLWMLKYQAQLATNDIAGAGTTGKAIVDKAIRTRNAMDLNHIAWTIVDPQGSVSPKDLDLAMKAATAANEFTGGKDAAILDTLARVYWLKGDKAKAIELQTKAVQNAEGSMKDDLERVLNEYKSAK